MTQPRAKRRPKEEKKLPDIVLRTIKVLNTIPEDRLAAMLVPRPDPQRYPTVQTRQGEDRRHASTDQQIRALLMSPTFIQLASQLPHNTLDVGKPGRPQDFPDYVLYAILMASGVTPLGSVAAILNHLSDPPAWGRFIRLLEDITPTHWTRVSQMPHDEAAWARAQRPRVTAIGPKPKGTRASDAIVKQHQNGTTRMPKPWPTRAHVRYLERRLTGWKIVDNQLVPLDQQDDYYDVDERLVETFTPQAVLQAQNMGRFDPDQPFQHKDPDLSQHVHSDGTVFKAPKDKRDVDNSSYDTHDEGGVPNKAYGTKFAILSTRIQGQPHSRVICSFAHVGTDKLSAASQEAEACVGLVLELRDLSHGGVKGIIMDSALRGQGITGLQRQWITVTNYPHAEKNPNRSAGQRFSEGRVEKDHLAKVVEHYNNGVPCYHYLYWYCGILLEKYVSSDGTPDVRHVEIPEYSARKNRGPHDPKNGIYAERREYFTVTINCTIENPVTTRVPLFHREAVEGVLEFNYGEYVRVFAPFSPQYIFLYACRNDTEARHAELKQRIKYMPRNVRGQRLRLLAAALAMNAINWQYHLQAHGEPNIFDNTE